MTVRRTKPSTKGILMVSGAILLLAFTYTVAAVVIQVVLLVSGR